LDIIVKVQKYHKVSDLPGHNIPGNSHMLMQDRNNLQIADLILKWINENIEL